MKKIMFLSLLVGMFCGGDNAVAANNCSIQKTHWAQGTMWGHTEEYLFVDKQGYSEKQGFICGRTACSTDTYIAITGARSRMHNPAISEYGLSLYKCELYADRYVWDSVAGVSAIADCSGDVQNWTRMGEIGAVEIYCKNAIATRSDNGFYCLGKSNMCKKTGGNRDVTPVVPGDTIGKCTFPDGKQYEVGARIEYDCSKISGDGVFAAEAKTGKTCYLSCMQRKGVDALENVWSVKNCASDYYTRIDFSASEQIYTNTIPGFKKCAKADTREECKDGEERATTDDAKLKLSTACENCSRLESGKCYSKKMLMCYRAMGAGHPVWWNNYDTCFCRTDKKLVGEWQDGRCVVTENQTFCQKLEQQHATTERMACCWAGNATEWVDANGKVVKDSLGKNGEYCRCKSANMKWNTSTHRCEAKKTTGGDDMCYYSFYGTIDCGNGKRVTRAVDATLSKSDLKKYGVSSCAAFKERYKSDVRGLDDLVKQWCEQYGETVQLDAATQNAIKKMNEFFAMSDSNRTVWRDTEGKFNTTRLASDATAGVVLGTVGGIVSGKIIKKKQLEKGFDVLHCTVGGQKMADYGDTFQVSFQR